MKKRVSTNRRNFICKSSALISASLIALPNLALSQPTSIKKYKMGLQLFTIREDMARDAKGTLKTMASLGYEDLETYGFDATQMKYYGHTASDFKKILTDFKLTTSSGHYDLFLYLDKPDELKRYVDKSIEGALALGQQYITWPWLTPESRTLEKFKLLSERLNVVGEQVKKGGLSFAYHNHDFEFIDHAGENGYEIIMRETDPSLVKLQIDLYWVMHSSKLSPAQLFAKQPGRFVMWHIKDMDKVSRDYTELGNGAIDYKAILPEASRSGMELYFLEQGGNFAKNPIQSVTDSAKYFRQHLERYLS